MEKIVENNKSLSWDGWMVIHRTASPTGWSSPDGAFINDVWHIQKRFELTAKGWDIPEKLVKKNDQ